MRSSSLRNFVFLAAVLFGPLLAYAQTPNAGDFAAQAAQVTELDVNGLKVIIKRRAGSPTVAGGLFIRGGARNMTEKNAGIERLMLATAVEAGKDLSRQNVRRELSSLGSAIGSSVSNDFSVVSLGSTRENFDRTWAIFAAVMMNPAFAEEDLNRNRAQILTGLREAGAVPESALETLQDRLLYAGHPYANDVNGTVATVGAFTAENLRAYHKHIMETSRLLLVFVGDLDAQQLRAKVAETFGKLPKGDHKDQPYPQLDFSKGTLDVTQRALPTTYVKGTFAAPPLNSPDYSTMRVAMSILQTLVYQEVRGRLQLSYAPDADMNNFAANTANISVSTNDPNQAVAAMLNQIKVLQTRTLNDEVIDEISAFFLTRHYLGQETSGAQVGELARYELIGGGWRNSFEFLNRIREVKAADVQAVANKYMKNIRFVVIGDQLAVNKSVFIPG